MRRLFLLLCLAFVSVRALAADGYPISVETTKEPNAVTLSVKNGGYAPVSVLIKLTVADNVAADAPMPAVAVIAARSTQRLVRIAQVNPRQGWRYEYNWNWRMGAYTATHSGYAAYRLPWMDGRTFRIGQAPGGTITSHTTPESRQAIDIGMPEGTPIVAARAGVVVEAVDEFSEGGSRKDLWTKANLVRVLHDDGTIGDYLHFMHRGVAVRAGERVAAGKLIGYAGSTGYSSGPHLHFAVLRTERQGDSFGWVSEPFSFYVGKPPQVFYPKTGLVIPANY